MFDDMDEMFNRFPMMGNSQALKAFTPAINMYETEKAVMVETPLAGIKPENVEVSVQKGILIIKGESKKEHEVDEKNYYRKEIRNGSFYREISLPTQVAEDQVTAEFDNGMLKVICPKAPAVVAKKIDVKIVKK